MGYALGVGIGVLALAGVLLLAWSVRSQGGERTTLWLALLAVALVVLDLVVSIAAVYYRVPPAWWVVIAAGVLVTLALFVRIGTDVRWRPGRVLALLGFAVAVLITVTVVQMFAPVMPGILPLEARAQQIAEEAGFDALLPPDEQMITEYLAVEAADIDGPALKIEYEGFWLVERAAATDADEASLRGVVDPGATPLGAGPPRVPDDATYTELTVDGEPAVGVSFEFSEPGYKGMFGAVDVSVVVCALDGVEVVLCSMDEMRYTGPDEQYEQASARSVEDLADVAGSLVPVE